jgi:hypothetical protein
MERETRREREATRKRYVASKRHTMQVDFDDYVASLAREMERGRKRARRLGNPLPVRSRTLSGPSAPAPAAFAPRS